MPGDGIIFVVVFLVAVAVSPSQGTFGNMLFHKRI